MRRLRAPARALVALVIATPGLAAAQQPVTPFGARKAEALLRDHLPCLGCHALGEEGGRIAPDLRTVGQRRSAAWIAAMVDDPQRMVPGSIMPRTAMPAATREAIVRYLQAGASAQPAVPATTAPASEANDGAALYARWCASCHGSTGRGDGPNAPHLPVKPAAHADAATMGQRPDDALFDTIAGGGAIMNRSPRMPAFGATLTGAQIRTLVAHIRQLCRCEGPSWSTR